MTALKIQSMKKFNLIKTTLRFFSSFLSTIVVVVALIEIRCKIKITQVCEKYKINDGKKVFKSIKNSRPSSLYLFSYTQKRHTGGYGDDGKIVFIRYSDWSLIFMILNKWIYVRQDFFYFIRKGKFKLLVRTRFSWKI